MLTPGDMAWDDHAIAYRSTLLIYLNLKYFQSDAEWAVIFNDSIDLHGRALHGFLRLPQFRGNNHGVFHIFALLNMVAALPKLDFSSYKTDAQARLFELLGEMINWHDGVTREQALEYQYIGLELVNEVVELSDFFGISSTAERFNELRMLLSKMVDFAYLMRWPDESVPAVGDTWLFWKGWSKPVWQIIESLCEAGYGSSATKQGIMRIRMNLADNFDLNNHEVAIFRESGHVYFKNAAASIGVYLKGGPPIHSHGHQDHLSIQYFAGNELVLVDSGGPYKYSNPYREYFVHPRAHNTVTCNGQSGFGYGVSSSTINVLTTSELFHVGAMQQLQEGVFHSRNVVLFHAQSVLVVFDEIQIDPMHESVAIQQFWHFQPTATIQEIKPEDTSRIGADLGDGLFHRAYSMTNKSEKEYFVSTHSSEFINSSIIRGELSPTMQGWVTTKVGEMIPAPVLCSELTTTVRSALFVTVVEDTRNTQVMNVSKSDAFVMGDEECTCFIISAGKFRWSLAFLSSKIVRATQLVDSDDMHKL